MTIGLGIDTGGTYTDAALVNYETGQVLASAKALTTRQDLALGISAAIDNAFRQPSAPRSTDVRLVGLSTTLATNAIVEDQGSPVCLILIGYDPQVIQHYGLKDALVADDVVYVQGGHDILGDEAHPLDEVGLGEAVQRIMEKNGAEVFAVSSYFSVRNPAHEIRAKTLIQEWTGLPVTCGHELTSRLNSVRRATTVALNARLVPLLQELIQTLRGVLDARSISAPLMIVRGDGSLVRAEWAMQRPIETVLSGPAASLVGARHLVDLMHAGGQLSALWAIDMGGTTSDIAAIRNGRPRLNPEGAQVGRWRTMVEAVDVYTIGLGGDSQVRLDAKGLLAVGPQRVVPLSLLAGEHPHVLEDLLGQTRTGSHDIFASQFVLASGSPRRALQPCEQALLQKLARGPCSLSRLAQESESSTALLTAVDRLVRERLVLRAGFTPTDALHALNQLALWDAQAARLGARILASQFGCEANDFCQRVVEEVSRQAATALIDKALLDEGVRPRWEKEPTAGRLLARALDGQGDQALRCALTLRDPVVAIGAPVEAFLPQVARQLHTELIIPPHAAVANAVGAIVGSVVLTEHVTITPLAQDTLRVHLPDGVYDFARLEQAVDFAHQRMAPWMQALSQAAGAAQVEVQVLRQDQNAQARIGWNDQVYLGTELTYTAIGRPSQALTLSPLHPGFSS